MGVVHAADTCELAVKAIIDNLHVPYVEPSFLALHGGWLTLE